MSFIPLPFFFFFTRTELLECYGDQDFLAKLHCVRQAFQVCPSSHNLPILPKWFSLFISGLPELGPVCKSWLAIAFTLAHQMPLKKEKVKKNYNNVYAVLFVIIILGKKKKKFSFTGSLIFFFHSKHDWQSDTRGVCIWPLVFSKVSVWTPQGKQTKMTEMYLAFLNYSMTPCAIV